MPSAFARPGLLFALALVLSFPAAAQEKKDPDREKPLEELWLQQRSPAMQPVLSLMITESLSALRFYPTDPLPELDNLRGAIKSFQRAIGSEPTGIILKWEFDELRTRAGKVRLREIDLISVAEIYSSESYVRVRGSWRYPNNESLPNVSEMQCERRTDTCVEAYAFMSSHNGTPDLSVAIERWSVLAWNADRLIAENNAICVLWLLTIDFKAEKASKTRRSSGADGCDMVSQETQTLDLVNGIDLFTSKDKQRLYNPGFVERMREIAQQVQRSYKKKEAK